MGPKETRTEWLVSIGQVLAWLITAAGVILTALFVREAAMDFLVWNGARRLQSFREAGEVGRALQIDTQIQAVDHHIHPDLLGGLGSRPDRFLPPQRPPRRSAVEAIPDGDRDRDGSYHRNCTAANTPSSRCLRKEAWRLGPAAP